MFLYFIVSFLFALLDLQYLLYISIYFLLSMFIVMPHYTKANFLYVKAYLAINLILIDLVNGCINIVILSKVLYKDFFVNCPFKDSYLSDVLSLA